MKYLLFLCLFLSLTASAQHTRIRQISYPISNGSITYPIIVAADNSVSHTINGSIRSDVFDSNESRMPLGSIIRAAVKNDGLSFLSYEVTFNENGILSLNISAEKDRVDPARSFDSYFNFDLRTGENLAIGGVIAALDSFKIKVLNDKKRALSACIESDLKPALEKKELDSIDYNWTLEEIRSCTEEASIDEFSLSSTGIRIVAPCTLPRAIRGLPTPDFDLSYSYETLAPLLKPEFQKRIANRSPGYRLIRLTSPHNSFPDTARDAGHLDGDHVFQPKKGHYDDSSVLLVVPHSFKPTQKIDLVFWYHGWHNNIDTALQFYGLARQFAASHVNAILVLPEAGKNVADSYGGKMNQKGMFHLLTNDVIAQLKKQRVVPADAEPGRIILAGHSGAFLVIANILDNGEQPVDEVLLFDALYSHVPSFVNWIGKDTQNHHFVHWFTNRGGGTDEVSDTMMVRLREQHWPFRLVDEEYVTPGVIDENKILFIHSPREHNVIINDPDDFQLLLEHSLHLRTR